MMAVIKAGIDHHLSIHQHPGETKEIEVDAFIQSFSVGQAADSGNVLFPIVPDTPHDHRRTNARAQNNRPWKHDLHDSAH